MRTDGGEIYLEQNRIAIKNPAEAFRKGFAFVSEDRRSESIIQRMTVRENLTIVLVDKFLTRLGLLNSRREREFASECVGKFDIRTPTIEQIAMNLSGGNQQKLAIAKALSTNPRILVLDEPTRGIDVQSKKYIYNLIKELAAQNVSTIVVSSETPEIIGLCHRVIVIREGRLVKELAGSSITEATLLSAAVGNI
jgi:ribose transport system ATP-binding protein